MNNVFSFNNTTQGLSGQNQRIESTGLSIY